MNERTTIETSGQKDGQVVRLRYVYDEEKNFPEIEIVNGENFPEVVREMWKAGLENRVWEPMKFRGLSLKLTDPVLVLAAMQSFYDEPPEEKIDDPQGFFECDPDVVY